MFGDVFVIACCFAGSYDVVVVDGVIVGGLLWLLIFMLVLMLLLL